MARSGSAKYADSDRTEAVFHYDRPTLTADTATTTINTCQRVSGRQDLYDQGRAGGRGDRNRRQDPSVPGIVPNRDGTVSIYSTAKETDVPLIYDATAR